MDIDMLKKLACGEMLSDSDLDTILFEICDTHHALNCNKCIIYKINDNKSPGSEKPFRENRGCDCFKNGQKMLEFIRNNARKD